MQLLYPSLSPVIYMYVSILLNKVGNPVSYVQITFI